MCCASRSPPAVWTLFHIRCVSVCFNSIQTHGHININIQYTALTAAAAVVLRYAAITPSSTLARLALAAAAVSASHSFDDGRGAVRNQPADVLVARCDSSQQQRSNSSAL